MGLKDFLIGGPTDTRNLFPVNKPVTGTAPIQHVNNIGSEPIRRLPIVRKCLGYIADTLNKANPRIVDIEGNVRRTRRQFPSWLDQPSAEYAYEEMIHQAVWSLFTNGYIRLLGSVKPNGVPSAVYVGTTSVISYSLSNGTIIYLDTPEYGNDDTIVANKVAFRRRFALPGQPRGIGEFEPARTLLNTALHAQDAIDRFFGNNMFIDLIFMHDGEYIEGVGANLIEQLAKRHAGPKRAFRPLVQDRKWKLERLKDSNQANQLLEIYTMVNTMVATQIFGIDPLVFSLSGGTISATSLTYQNASNLRSQVWQQAVEPVGDVIAATIGEYLRVTGEYFEFDPSDFLRGSPSDRAQLVANMALASKHSEKELWSEEEYRGVLGYRGSGPGPSAPREV